MKDKQSKTRQHPQSRNETQRMILDYAERLIYQLQHMKFDGEGQPIDPQLKGMLTLGVIQDYIDELQFFAFKGNFDECRRTMDTINCFMEEMS